MPRRKERLRGRPRRASPWKPCRPSLSPSNSPPPGTAISQADFHDSTAHIQPTANSIRQELVPRLPSSIRRLLFAPIHSSNLASARAFGTNQPPPERPPERPTTPTSDSTSVEPLKDKLAILYDLVFELHQGVEDLRFRVQLTDEKVAHFLKILSSLSEAVLSPPLPPKDSATPTEDIPKLEATYRGKDNTCLSAAKMEPEQGERAAMDVNDNARISPGAATKEQTEAQWGDGTVVIEEEPWLGDLSATWQPGV